MIDEVLAYFRDLRRTYAHAPYGRGMRHVDKDGKYQIAVNNYRLAQLEMYNLAQVVCYFHAPEVQTKLDDTRRKIMKELQKQIEQSRTGDFSGSVMILQKRYRPSRWEDFMLTPELTFSPDVTGLAVPQHLVTSLKRLHKEQVRIVNNLTVPRGNA